MFIPVSQEQNNSFFLLMKYSEYSCPKVPPNIAGYAPQITTLMYHLKLF